VGVDTVSYAMMLANINSERLLTALKEPRLKTDHFRVRMKVENNHFLHIYLCFYYAKKLY